MERPKVEVTPKDRTVTGEVMYLDEARRLGNEPKSWPDDIGDTAIQMYEAEATIANENGWRPAILDEYETYDRQVSDLGASCAALADELLEFKKPGSEWSFEDYVIELSPEEVVAKLQNIRTGTLLATADDQLAIPSNGEHYPVLDIRKKDMALRSVGLRVYGWSERKYVFTNAPGEQYNYPEDLLRYPSDEQSKWYEFELTFNYVHPEASVVTEAVQLSVGQRGGVRVSSQIWALAYAETGYEGHGRKNLNDASDEDINQFADLIAEIVGDEPEAIWQRQERVIREFIPSVADETSREYLQELLDNMSAGLLIGVLNMNRVGEQTLGQALKKGDPEAALQALIAIVDEKRTRRNDLAADEERSQMLMGEPIEPWRDRVRR